jgi:hypothetical protein
LAGIFFEPNGTTYTPFFGATGNSLVSYTQGLERARIDSSGRLLVGTFTSPSSGFGQYAKLVVQGQPADATGGGNFSIQRGEAAAGGNITSGEGIGNISWNDNAGNTFGLISCEADANAGTNDYPGRLVFSTTRDGASSTTAALWLDSDQRLGLGAINSSDARAQITATGNGYNLYLDANATYAGLYRFIRFRINTAITGSIESNGTTTTYATTSDYRVKENLIPLAGAINRVNQLQPYRFNFISNPDLTVDGFIAHEVQSIVPEAIVGTKDEVDADGNPVHQGIDQSKLVPLLTAALQEALAEIESLKARVTALEP